MRFLEKLKKKHYILCGLAILLTGVIVYLFCPLYLSAEQKLNMQNDTARIDIYNYGSKENAIKILSDTKYSEPSWCKKDNGNCSVITENISRKWRKYNIKFKVIGDGNIQIRLRGPDRRNAENKRYKILVDYRSFTVNNKKIFKDAKSVWHDNPFQYHFKAKDGDIILLNIKARRHFINFKTFDKLIFLSVLILAFLFSYKLVHYVSKFKIIENNSRIDIVFVVVFALLLFVPMSHISDAQKSVQENRMLAKYPVFFANNGINSKYGTQFESWFNDRFFGRKELLDIYTNISQINSVIQNNSAIKAKNDMIFSKYALATLSKPIPDARLKKISEQIKKVQQWATTHGITLYVMIPPSKEDIYKYYLSDYYTNVDRENSILFSLVKYLKNHNNLSIIYPRKVYMKKYSDYTHYKTDHHWTEFGAFLGYQELIKIIQKDFPSIIPLKESDFYVFYKTKPRLGSFKSLFERPFYEGSNCKALNLADDCPLSYSYKYFDHKDLKNLKIRKGPINMSRITHYEKGIDRNVTLLGNSYGGFLMEFLPYNFKSVQMLRVNNNEKNIDNIYDMKRFEKHILDFKTDILIIYQQSDQLYKFEKLYDK